MTDKAERVICDVKYTMIRINVGEEKMTKVLTSPFPTHLRAKKRGRNDRKAKEGTKTNFKVTRNVTSKIKKKYITA